MNFSWENETIRKIKHWKKIFGTYVINLLYRDLDCNSFRLWWRALRLVRVAQVQSPCKWVERPWRRCHSESSGNSIHQLNWCTSIAFSTYHSHFETRHILSLLIAWWVRGAFRFLQRRLWLVLAFFVWRYWLLCIFINSIRWLRGRLWQVFVAVR